MKNAVTISILIIFCFLYQLPVFALPDLPTNICQGVSADQQKITLHITTGDLTSERVYIKIHLEGPIKQEDLALMASGGGNASEWIYTSWAGRESENFLELKINMFEHSQNQPSPAVLTTNIFGKNQELLSMQCTLAK